VLKEGQTCNVSIGGRRFSILNSSKVLGLMRCEVLRFALTTQEDQLVRELVGKYGAKKWSLIASHLPGRIGKQCRERWTNHLDSSIKKGNWEPWEDKLIIKLQREHGNKWAKIAKHLPGRFALLGNRSHNSGLITLLRTASILPSRDFCGSKDVPLPKSKGLASKPKEMHASRGLNKREQQRSASNPTAWTKKMWSTRE
jgi:hypothetical protein